MPSIDFLSSVFPTVRSVFRSPSLFRVEALAGLVVAIALIPEAISFSIIAGVPPQVGLFASFTMSVVIAFTGGRPAMISAATGAVALVVAPVSREHGMDYLVATVLLAGGFQVVLSLAGLTKLMRFVPRSVMVGFVNALAILIFLAQFPQLVHVPWAVYAMVVVGVAAMLVLPRFTTLVPAPLVVIVVLTGVCMGFSVRVPTVGDQGALPGGLPMLGLPHVPLTLATLEIIGPYALAMALVGLLESMMTAKLVDDITDTHSNKVREGWGQGVANIVTGFFGGMGGCAMIGQTMINVRVSGARTRVSTFLAGVFLLILVVALRDMVVQIPMAALVAVMIIVSVKTLDLHSVNPRVLRRMPVPETLVMLSTVAVTVATGDLAYGVIVGVLVAMVLFARRVAHLTEVVDIAHPDENTRVYAVRGELFFASSNDLAHQFDYTGDPHNVVIDMSEAHIWDFSSVAALDAITTKYQSKGKNVRIVGLNQHSQERHARLSPLVGGGE